MSPFTRPRDLLGPAAGFLLWSSAFLVLYGLHELGCAAGWDAMQAGPVNGLRLALVAVWLVHIAAFVLLILIVRRLQRRVANDSGPRLVGHISLALALAALVATVWVGLPVFAHPLCR